MSGASYLLMGERSCDPETFSIAKLAPDNATVPDISVCMYRTTRWLLLVQSRILVSWIAWLKLLPREVIVALVLVDLPVDLQACTGIEIALEEVGGT
jgi:hypothetical protein